MDHLGNSSLRNILWKRTNVCLVRKVMWLLRNFSAQRSCICGTLRPPLRPLPRPPLRPPQSAVAVHKIALCLPSPLPTTLLATLPECTHRFSGSLASCWFGTRASMSRRWQREGRRLSPGSNKRPPPSSQERSRLLPVTFFWHLFVMGSDKTVSASWTSRPWDGERSLVHQPYGVH